MKTLFPGKAFLLVIMFTLLTFSVEAAEYYVVIGSFKEESNAAKFTRDVRNIFKDVSYSFNGARKVYLVHVLKTTQKEEARNWSLYLKNEAGFKDAWVFTDVATQVNSSTTAAENQTHREPRFSATVQTAETTHDVVLASSSASGNIANYGVRSNPAAKSLAEAWTHKEEVSYIRNVENLSGLWNNNGINMGKVFTFIVEDPQGKSMPAEVLMVNFEKAKTLAAFQAGEQVAIRGTRREQMVTLVCEVLGYGMETRVFNIDHLSRGRDIRQNEDGVWEVRFKLKKMEPYDQAILYKTTFYPDAAVLQPSSKQELDALVTLMKQNPHYKIVIHSHCNQGTRRDIALSNKNYFDEQLSSVRKGSDKVLTKERAKVIRKYLTDQGIAKKRVGVVGWGSMEMIVNPTSEDVRLNERVEFELVSCEL